MRSILLGHSREKLKISLERFSELVAIVTEQGGKVTIDYKDEDSKSFLEPVKFLGHQYSTSDGEAYMDSLEKAFSQSSCIFLTRGSILRRVK